MGLSFKTGLLGSALTLMSASIASAGTTSSQSAPAKILFVVSNQVTSEQTGWPIGFWLSELALPYSKFVQKGYEVTIASPLGGKVVWDDMSDPTSPKASGVDLVSTGFKTHPHTLALLENTSKLSLHSEANFDAIFVVGGLGPMKTFANNQELQQLFARFYEKGKASVAICHGTSILLKTKLSNGKLLVDGHRWTGFTDAEEDAVDKMSGKKVQAWRIQSEAQKLSNTTFVHGLPFKPHAIADKNLITGQQGSSGAVTADLVIQFLEAPKK